MTDDLRNRIRRALARHCPIHDQPSPQRIAELEVATGINPNAVAELNGNGVLPSSRANLNLIDCGNRRCHQRRNRQP